MRAAASSLFTPFEHPSSSVTLKIWSKTGTNFEEMFVVDRTTFADVKNSALRHFNTKFPFEHLTTLRSTLTQRMSTNSMLNTNEIENYKLISIESRRTVDEKKKLNEERVKDGGFEMIFFSFSSTFVFVFSRRISSNNTNFSDKNS